MEETSPAAEVRRVMATDQGYDPAVWRIMSADLGVQGLVIPENYGGSGYTYRELGIIFEEAGRALLCTPLFSTIGLATSVLLCSGAEDAKHEFLPRIANGELVATFAVNPAMGKSNDNNDSPDLTASKVRGGWELSGTRLFVLDGQIADVIFVTGRTPAGVELYAVDADSMGLDRTPMQTMDPTRPQSVLHFNETPARLVRPNGGRRRQLRRALDLAAVALAAEQLGGAQYTLEMSVEYAKQRFQFGRPIGSFQAIKHQCADILMQVESARSAVYYALWAASESAHELPVAASLAQSICGPAYVRAAANNIHVHGGIGFTWEHPAHLYFRRAKSSHALLGGSSYHLDSLADRLGI